VCNSARYEAAGRIEKTSQDDFVGEVMGK